MPPKKKPQLPKPIPQGTVLKDAKKKCWCIGPSVGKGGFGEVYSACEGEKDVPSKRKYVVKIEPIVNGPILIERAFFMRACPEDKLKEWKDTNGLKFLGVPSFYGFGLHKQGNDEYRFNVMQKLGTDFWSYFLKHGKKLDSTLVGKIAIQMVDALEYIHDKGYTHGDVKGENMLFESEKSENVYLVDYGLAEMIKKLDVFKPDPKRKHNGTLPYVSCDMHQGVSTMRGDLQILGFNLLLWLTSSLPWEDSTDPEAVFKMKQDFIADLKSNKNKNVPEVVKQYLLYLENVDHSESPDYENIREIIQKHSGIKKSPLKRSKPTTAGNKKRAKTDPKIDKISDDSESKQVVNVKARGKKGQVPSSSASGDSGSAEKMSWKDLPSVAASGLFNLASGKSTAPKEMKKNASKGNSKKVTGRKQPAKGKKGDPSIKSDNEVSEAEDVNSDIEMKDDIDTKITRKKQAGKRKAPSRGAKKNAKNYSEDELSDNESGTPDSEDAPKPSKRKHPAKGNSSPVKKQVGKTVAEDKLDSQNESDSEANVNSKSKGSRKKPVPKPKTFEEEESDEESSDVPDLKKRPLAKGRKRQAKIISSPDNAEEVSADEEQSDPKIKQTKQVSKRKVQADKVSSEVDDGEQSNVSEENGLPVRDVGRRPAKNQGKAHAKEPDLEEFDSVLKENSEPKTGRNQASRKKIKSDSEPEEVLVNGGSDNDNESKENSEPQVEVKKGGRKRPAAAKKNVRNAAKHDADLDVQSDDESKDNHVPLNADVNESGEWITPKGKDIIPGAPSRKIKVAKSQNAPANSEEIIPGIGKSKPAGPSALSSQSGKDIIPGARGTEKTKTAKAGKDIIPGAPMVGSRR